MSLNRRVEQLEKLVEELRNKLLDISKNTEEKQKNPYTKLGGESTKGIIKSPAISTGLCATMGGSVAWNDTDLSFPPFGQTPKQPKKGYNWHGHSRFAGGALDKDTLEIVEFLKDGQGFILDKYGNKVNKYCLGLAKNELKIVSEKNTKGESILKVGLLDLVFNPDTESWGCPAYEINVKKCYLVMRDKKGNIELDEKGQEKKSLLYNEDVTKTSVVWDKNAKCFRFYAVYANGEE